MAAVDADFIRKMEKMIGAREIGVNRTPVQDTDKTEESDKFEVSSMVGPPSSEAESLRELREIGADSEQVNSSLVSEETDDQALTFYNALETQDDAPIVADKKPRPPTPTKPSLPATSMNELLSLLDKHVKAFNKYKAKQVLHLIDQQADSDAIELDTNGSERVALDPELEGSIEELKTEEQKTEASKEQAKVDAEWKLFVEAKKNLQSRQVDFAHRHFKLLQQHFDVFVERQSLQEESQAIAQRRFALFKDERQITKISEGLRTRREQLIAFKRGLQAYDADINTRRVAVQKREIAVKTIEADVAAREKNVSEQEQARESVAARVTAANTFLGYDDWNLDDDDVAITITGYRNGRFDMFGRDGFLGTCTHRGELLDELDSLAEKGEVGDEPVPEAAKCGWASDPRTSNVYTLAVGFVRGSELVQESQAIAEARVRDSSARSRSRHEAESTEQHASHLEKHHELDASPGALFQRTKSTTPTQVKERNIIIEAVPVQPRGGAAKSRSKFQEDDVHVSAASPRILLNSRHFDDRQHSPYLSTTRGDLSYTTGPLSIYEGTTEEPNVSYSPTAPAADKSSTAEEVSKFNSDIWRNSSVHLEAAAEGLANRVSAWNEMASDFDDLEVEEMAESLASGVELYHDDSDGGGREEESSDGDENSEEE